MTCPSGVHEDFHEDTILSNSNMCQDTTRLRGLCLLPWQLGDHLLRQKLGNYWLERQCFFQYGFPHFGKNKTKMESCAELGDLGATGWKVVFLEPTHE